MLTVLYICIIISFINAYAYGLYDIVWSFLSRNFKIHFTKLPVRHVNKVYLLVPTMNENGVVLRCANYLIKIIRKAKSVWPSLSYRIIFIDDDSKDGTVGKLKYISHKYPTVVHVIYRKLPNAQKGKGMSLNNALRWIDNQHDNPEQTIIGVIDSDSTPGDKLLLSLIPAFEYSHYGLIQTSILINNVKSFLTIMQHFEFSVPNFLAQSLRTRIESGLASGNGQFMTLEMANKVHWHNSLLDDLEFSINGLLHGFYGAFLSTVSIPQEGVLKYRPLIKQRTRWCQGGMQCLVKYARPIIHCKYLSFVYKINLILGMVFPFFSIIFEPCSILSIALIIYYLFTNPVDTIFPVIMILIVNVLITLVMTLSVKHISGKSFHTITDGHFFQIVMGNFIYPWLLSPVPFISLFRLFTHKNGWVKTSH